MKNLLSALVILTILSSCNRVYYQEAYLLEETIKHPLPENDIEIKTFFGGDAIDYITFQVEIENNTNDTIKLADTDISMKLDKDYRRQVKFYPIPKEDLIYDLENTAEEFNRERKAQRTGSIIASGAGILGNILLGGAGAAESIIYGVNDAAIIAEDDRRGRLAESSIEDQIKYHDEFTLDRAIILPGGFASFDVHYERPMYDGRCEVEVRCADEKYRFDYMLEVVRVRD